MGRLRRNRLIALVAAVTLIVALGACSGHGFLDRVHENGHCDLYVHFSGTAGSPAHASVIGKPAGDFKTKPDVAIAVFGENHVARDGGSRRACTARAGRNHSFIPSPCWDPASPPPPVALQT